MMHPEGNRTPGADSRAARLSRRWWLGAGGLLASTAVAGAWGVGRWKKAREESAADEEYARSTIYSNMTFCFVSERDSGVFIHTMRVLERVPDYAPAYWLRACMDLDAGIWDKAQSNLEHPAVRELPEGRLLREVMERQPVEGRWLTTFLESWRALGQPDFSQSTFLPPAAGLADFSGRPYFYDHRRPEPTELQRLMLMLLSPADMEREIDWLLEQVRASGSLELLTTLCEALLPKREEMKPELRQALLPVVRERVAELAGPSPKALRLALLPLLPMEVDLSNFTPFMREELERLESLVSLPVWRESSSERTFQWVRSELEKQIMPNSHYAYEVARGLYGLCASVWLHGRAKASREVQTLDEQRWMGKLLWEVGARQCEQRSVEEREQGLKLQLLGSELTGHERTRLDAIDRWVLLGKQTKHFKRAALDRWPIRTLQRELLEARARDERSLVDAFAPQRELP